MNITFIGVGAIGLPMALQIQAAEHTVTGVDVLDAIIANAKWKGIKTVSNFSVAPRAEIVVVMVAIPDQLAGLVNQVGEAA